jgi:hypothetical protein
VREEIEKYREMQK